MHDVNYENFCCSKH